MNDIRLVVEHFQQNIVGDLTLLPLIDAGDLDIAYKCLPFFFLPEVTKLSLPAVDGDNEFIDQVSANQLFDRRLTGIQNIDAFLTMKAPKRIFQVIDENPHHYLQLLFRGIVFNFGDGNVDGMEAVRPFRRKGDQEGGQQYQKRGSHWQKEIGIAPLK